MTPDEFILGRGDPLKADFTWAGAQMQKGTLTIKPDLIVVGTLSVKFNEMKDMSQKNVPVPAGAPDGEGKEYWVIRIEDIRGSVFALRALKKNVKQGNGVTQDLYPKLKGRFTHRTVQQVAVEQIREKKKLADIMKTGASRPMGVGAFEVVPKGQKAVLQILKGSADGDYRINFQMPGVVRQSTEIPHKVDPDLLKRLMGKLDQISQALNVLRTLPEDDPARAKMDKARESLQKFGNMLYLQMIPPSLQNSIKELKVAMDFGLDETLVEFPWELLHTGANFMCLEKPLGRFVASASAAGSTAMINRGVKQGVKFLLVVDPDGSLPGARTEGATIKAELERIAGVTVKILQGQDADSMNVLSEIAYGYDFLHYSGHAVFDAEKPDNSGMLLSDGVLKAYSLVGAMKGNPPILAFINACESGKQADWTKGETKYENEVAGLASAFLLNGINFIGPMWPVYDDAALAFSQNFYNLVLSGTSLGEAVMSSKKLIFDSFAGEEIAWASYSFYGDPTQTLDIKK